MFIVQILDLEAVAPTARVCDIHTPELSIICHQAAGAWEPLCGLEHDGCDGYFQFELPSCFTLHGEAVLALDLALAEIQEQAR